MSKQRESLLRLLKGDNPGEVVWTADISYWMDARKYDGSADTSWSTEEGYLALCRELRIMPYYWYDEFWLAEPEYDTTVEVTVAEKDKHTRRTWTTPIGEITEELMFMEESCSTAHTKFAVENRADLDIFRYLLEHRRLRPACIDDYPRRLELWRSYDGIPSIALLRSPLSAFFYEWAGVLNGVYLINDYPDEVRSLFALMEEQELPVLEAVCDLAPPLVHFADNLSSDNLAGLYDDFMAPGHRKRIEKLHESGVACAVHLDGVVRGLLPKLAASGFDAVEALTPFPGGDLPVEEMRDIAGSDSVILWGGVPGILFAPPATWDDMERHVTRVLEAWSGTRFILGVADQVPPDGDISFCPKIAELVEQFQP